MILTIGISKFHPQIVHNPPPNAMTNEQFKLQNEAMEVLETLEDMVEYVCREQQISGEKVWTMVNELSRIKLNEFPNYEEETNDLF